jgi:uncharacterized protein (TIGR00255 family)
LDFIIAHRSICMILSMTGFGTASVQRDNTSATVEVRTVNHRFLDIHVRLGREFGFLENDIQQYVRGKISRGRVDVNVTIRAEEQAAVLFDAALARNYYEASERLRNELQLQGSVDIRTLLTLPGIIKDRESAGSNEGRLKQAREAALESLEQSIQGVLEMREQEGRALQDDMLRHLAEIAQKNRQIQGLVPKTVEEYKSKLEERLSQLLPPKMVDPQRLAQEAAILAERSDISEETARLSSHLDQYHSLLKEGKEIGKKLDFLLQEMQREINTILSKTGNLEITRMGIGAKADIEKLREQVQNVE